MMERKRIIPCLDLKEGRVVKGIGFVGLRDAGDPVEFARYYEEQGADELVLLDIAASSEKRNTMLEVVEAVAKVIRIPIAVGGGISTVADMERVFAAGAQKASVNSAAILNPDIIQEGAKTYGSNKIVVAIDAKYNPDQQTWDVYTHGGMKKSEWEVVSWAQRVAEIGAGEILLTSIDADGEKNGYDIALTAAVSEAVSIPVIASGGAGKRDDFVSVFSETNASAALAASIFHFKETSVGEVKSYLKEKGVAVG